MDINTLIFNNKNSLEDLKIGVEEFPQLPLSYENVKEINIKGRNGTYTQKLHTYNDKKLVFKLVLLDKSLDNITIINNWLNNITDNRLFYGRDNVYYKVKSVSVSGLQQSAYFFREGRFTVTFVCDPFLYFLDNKKIIITENTTINSPIFAIESLPILSVYRKEGDNNPVTITVNDKSFTLTNYNNYYILDSNLKECYVDWGDMNMQMTGKFPTFKNGKNTIKIDGKVEKLEIIPNWRCL